MSMSTSDPNDHWSVVTAVIDANRFMTMATANAHGTPWANPVWFATDDHRRFLWVSSSETRHSRNIETRPEIAIVIYDSRTTPAERQAVYLEAVAHQVSADQLADAIEIFSRASVEHGLSAWGRDDVTEPRLFRMYEATATQHWILGETDVRIPVPMP
jgi:nitroimidazol reductase NimA-like FMN-containing flavoprotein (pyridoxamine 5'-phosphate oxidase superfamily)